MNRWEGETQRSTRLDDLHGQKKPNNSRNWEGGAAQKVNGGEPKVSFTYLRRPGANLSSSLIDLNSGIRKRPEVSIHLSVILFGFFLPHKDYVLKILFIKPCSSPSSPSLLIKGIHNTLNIMGQAALPHWVDLRKNKSQGTWCFLALPQSLVRSKYAIC